MTPDALAELRQIFQPLVDDIDADDWPEITAATLAARREAA